MRTRAAASLFGDDDSSHEPSAEAPAPARGTQSLFGSSGGSRAGPGRAGAARSALFGDDSPRGGSLFGTSGGGGGRDATKSLFGSTDGDDLFEVTRGQKQRPPPAPKKADPAPTTTAPSAQAAVPTQAQPARTAAANRRATPKSSLFDSGADADLFATTPVPAAAPRAAERPRQSPVASPAPSAQPRALSPSTPPPSQRGPVAEQEPAVYVVAVQETEATAAGTASMRRASCACAFVWCD